MLDTTTLDKYLEAVKEKLGKAWLIEADETRLGSFHSAGSIAKSYAISCFMAKITITKCVNRIKSTFPEAKDEG